MVGKLVRKVGLQTYLILSGTAGTRDICIAANSTLVQMYAILLSKRFKIALKTRIATTPHF